MLAKAYIYTHIYTYIHIYTHIYTHIYKQFNAAQTVYSVRNSLGIFLQSTSVFMISCGISGSYECAKPAS